MRIGAYQFAVSGSMEENRSRILAAVEQAAGAGVELLIFPECAVTGYPPLEIPSCADISEEQKEEIHTLVRQAAVRNRMYIILGTIVRQNTSFFIAALAFAPDGTVTEYDKRALWGWDRENFVPGNRDGIIQVGPVKAGIRICYEVRFPEYFRELFAAETDLDIILFHDVSGHADPDRYSLIRGHVQTRAVENACPVLTVNAARPYQTAPTVLFDASGRTLCEAESGKDILMVCDFEKKAPDFGELGRKTISGRLLKNR